jgi:hypothetical protein
MALTDFIFPFRVSTRRPIKSGSASDTCAGTSTNSGRPFIAVYRLSNPESVSIIRSPAQDRLQVGAATSRPTGCLAALSAGIFVLAGGGDRQRLTACRPTA